MWCTTTTTNEQNTQEIRNIISREYEHELPDFPEPYSTDSLYIQGQSTAITSSRFKRRREESFWLKQALHLIL